MWLDLNAIAESLLLKLQAIIFSEISQNLTQNDGMVRMPLKRSNILLQKGTSFISVNARKATCSCILIRQRQKDLCKNRKYVQDCFSEGGTYQMEYNICRGSVQQACLVNLWLHLRNEWCPLVLILQRVFYYWFRSLKEQVLFEKLGW